ncbi:MAG: GIY-YIG nuclease family protein [Proteobacteria bacterium]|nr:GIY-YIG nuclease family protein [Pseudomonadota bacterium]
MPRELTYFVYILCDKPYGTLYIGVTSNLPKRTYEHRMGDVEGFTKKYGLKMLVYYESYSYVYDAIAREKQLKHWQRDWKIDLIHGFNRDWKDLYEELNN